MEDAMPDRGLPTRNGSREVSAYSRDPFSIFRREMDELFDQFLAPSGARSSRVGPGSSWPSIEVHENEDAYTIAAEVPGMDAKDVELNLRDNALTLSGEKVQEQTSEDGGRSWTERSYGRFERTIPFETEIDADRVSASCRNGVLTVTLPKNPKAKEKSRRIEIKPN
jgi:HSP20 family protein